MNGSEKLHLIDENFQSQISEECDLLMQITSSRFSYAVINQEQVKVLFDAPLNQENEMKDFFENDPLLKLHFHRVKVATDTFKFTFIPTEVYADENLKDYNKYIQISPSNLFLSDISAQKIKNITSLDNGLKRFLNEKFQNHTLVSSANPLIEAATRIYADSGKQLILNLNAHSFEAIVLENSKLLFYNIFSIAKPDDFNYFLLFILKELDLNPAEISPIVCGQIETSSETYHRLQKYFARIKFADPSLLIHLPSAFRLAPVHHFFSLIGLNLCE